MNRPDSLAWISKSSGQTGPVKAAAAVKIIKGKAHRRLTIFDSELFDDKENL